MAASVRDLEEQLAQLTDAEKAQLVMKLLPALSHAFAGVEKQSGVCGGDACVVRTRIPAWTLECYRRLGWTEAQILDNFPELRASDLVNVWAYVDAHGEEIEIAIRDNDEIQDDVLLVRQRVLAEAERFKAKLPHLLLHYAEQWVVFRDDDVIGTHATAEEAYVAGLKRFGLDGGHVIAVVREPENVEFGAAVALGL